MALVYVKTLCFDTFPFPEVTAQQKVKISGLAEEMDAHRKGRIAAYPYLTLTGMYNVLAMVREGVTLTAAARDVHDAGQISILRDIQDRLDDAVAQAYGMVAAAPVRDILDQLITLNRRRLREEANGQIRWLRPALQAPAVAPAEPQPTLDIGDQQPIAAAFGTEWPRDLAGQFVTLRSILAVGPADAAALRRRLSRPPQAETLRNLLAAMKAMGQARDLGDGRWSR